MQSNPVIEDEMALDGAISAHKTPQIGFTMEAAPQKEDLPQIDVNQHSAFSMDTDRQSTDGGFDTCREETDLFERLFTVFERFCRFGVPSGQLSAAGVPLMDGSRYVKIFRDAGILGGNHGLSGRRATSTDCDIVFNSIRRINERKINFDQFVASIDALAARIGTEVAPLLQLVAASTGPTLMGTTTPHAPALATGQRLSLAERSQLATERSMLAIERSTIPTARHSIGSPYKHQRAEVNRSPRYSLRSQPNTEKMVRYIF
ncbi:hypothetical protein MDAP_000382 [Mitosporidium daphniae]|uniref:Uncharacterized protein n=1 Tax=Mitosporidium daphniae TaxID=1485682 RepID=A0A098VRC2_9MICR|nr:uncharacterized protein DI09_38p140 [Mitosporidium daphniae]KGG51344.1 hypothetical protein DI09_38p140 [Mitosporidium daphniae]|eukprot:XP_013237771.1 uncharacterized protein DI09_38p140 [Mitosporidium daphniae]